MHVWKKIRIKNTKDIWDTVDINSGVSTFKSSVMIMINKVFNNIYSEVTTDSELNSAQNNWQDTRQLLLKRPSQKYWPLKTDFEESKSTTVGVTYQFETIKKPYQKCRPMKTNFVLIAEIDFFGDSWPKCPKFRVALSISIKSKLTSEWGGWWVFHSSST